MNSVINMPIVLALNRSFQIVGVRSVKHAIKALCGGLPGQTEPAQALMLDYPTLPDGTPNLEDPIIVGKVSWGEWIKLPVRDTDNGIRSSRGMIRVPVAIVEPEYSGMPMVDPRVSSRGVFERDGNVCQYTNRVLDPEDLSIDHVIPRDRGGTNHWTNLVTCDRRVNMRKGNRLNHEAGLKLVRRPFRPKARPFCATVTKPRHPSWVKFMVARAA